MAIDVGKLVEGMLQAARDVLVDKWPEAKDFAETEFKKIGEDILLIQRLRAEGKISQKRAKLHMKIQLNTAKMTLLAVEGLGIIAVEQAINAALRVVRDTVNTALGFRLL